VISLSVTHENADIARPDPAMSVLPRPATRGRFVGKPEARFRSFVAETPIDAAREHDTPAPQQPPPGRSAVIDDLVKNGYVTRRMAAQLYSLAGLDGAYDGH